MKPVVAIIAQGEMGSQVGWRLVENGLRVITSLAGRSEASAQRARKAGIVAVDDDEIANADLLLAILPPGDAPGLATRLAPSLSRGDRKPVYVECNAVSPETVKRIAAIIEPTGCPFVDAGILGGAPKKGYDGPAFYASGDAAPRFAELRDYGLDIRVLAGGVGAASAMKMSFAGMTKGVAGLLSAMMMAASRAGVADALIKELEETQPDMIARLRKHVPGMYPKAYRWIAEMEEIADFVSEDPAAKLIYEGAAHFYERLAADVAGDKKASTALQTVLARKS